MQKPVIEICDVGCQVELVIGSEASGFVSWKTLALCCTDVGFIFEIQQPTFALLCGFRCLLFLFR